MSKKQKNKQQLYTDEYFEKGHWLLKIRQTLMSLIGWLAVIIPIVITVTSFWASFNPKVPHIWSYPEGILEIKFIGVILLFAFVMSGIFSISMTIIQNRKRQRLVQQWPTFNPINQKKRENTIDIFIDNVLATKNSVKTCEHITSNLNRTSILMKYINYMMNIILTI